MGWGKGKGKGGGGILGVIQQLLGGGGGGGKGWGKGKGNQNGDIVWRAAKSHPERVAWIGGLDKAIGKEGNKKLKEHFQKVTGTDPKFVNISGKGQGGAVFGSEEEAQAAIAAVNGTSFMGKTLEVDVWTKKDKN